VAPKILSIHDLLCGNPCTFKLSIEDVTNGIKEEEKASRRCLLLCVWKKTSHFGKRKEKTPCRCPCGAYVDAI